VSKIFDASIDFEDYLELCAGRSVSGGWAYIVTLTIPGLPRLEKLAFVGHRSSRMYQSLNFEGGPSLYWSCKNLSGFPKWTRDGVNSPYAVEITAKLGSGDDWVARRDDDSLVQLQTTELAVKIADALVEQVQVE
jgi:hypothetical protein